MNEQARVMPHDLDAERAVLGAIMLRPDVLFDVAAIVTPETFWRDAHRRIFRHMLALSEAKVEIDGLTLRESLTRANELEQVDGPAYVYGLPDGVPRSTNAVEYARIVRDMATRRRMIHAGHQLASNACEADQSAADILDAAQLGLFAIAEQTVTGGFVDMKTLMTEAMESVEALVADPQSVTGVATGFRDLDDMTRGLQAGDLIIVAARPSMGKTAFALNVAQHAALKDGRRVAAFSLEMSRKSLALRLLASEGRIDHHRLLNGRLSDADYGRLSSGMGRLASAGIYIDDSSNVSTFDVRAKCRRLKADNKGLDLIVIDYLQLMTGAKAENKNLEVAAITKALKAVAKDLDVPVVLLSQLNRESERRGIRPQLSNLRDSGSIEQDADVVILLHREDKYTPTDENRGVAEAILAKQRNGPTGTVRLMFFDHLVRFDNLEHRSERTPYEERRG